MTVQEKTIKKVSTIGVFDKLVMTGAFFALCSLAGLGVLRFIQAEYWTAHILAGVTVGFLCYALLSPLLRRV